MPAALPFIAKAIIGKGHHPQKGITRIGQSPRSAALLEELNGGQLPGGRRADITLAIFPHLREFIAVDLRSTPAQVRLMSTDDVFNDAYFREVESEFGAALREGGDHPFAHMMSLPTLMDDILRGVAMNVILDRLGVDFYDDEQLPEVVVFVISGPMLAAPVEQLVEGFTDYLSGRADAGEIVRWADTLRDLVLRECAAVPVTAETLGESLTGDALDPYILWQNRN